MLSWLKGGPSTAYASEDARFASASNDDELRHGNINITEHDEDAFTDTSSEEDLSSDDVQPPQTPAPMFALKAIRTVVWGTPAPPKPRERPARRKKRSPKSKRVTAAAKEEKKKEGELPMNDATEKHTEQPITTRVSRPNPKSLDPIPFKISAKPNLFDPSSSSTTGLPHATPNRPPSPAKGILMTPGTGLNRKKAVSFHPSVGETTPPPRNGRIRSGLPHEFPGKFPSPWTPRVGTPQHKRSISVPGPSSPSRTLTFEDGPLNLDKGKRSERSTASNPTGYYEVGEDSRITDYLDDSSDEKADQQLQREVSIHEEGNLTVDMEAPRSSSGKFWKERTQKIEDVAQEKVERLRTRCKIATGYAKKKDELCVDLAEKIRELIEKNKRLKAELKRLNQQPENATAFTRTTSSRATGHGSRALEEALHTIEERDMQIAAHVAEKARMENAFQEHKQRVETYEELLNTREDKITELSMSMYNGGDDEYLEEAVVELRKKLRVAKQDVKELGLVRIEARSLRERVGSLEQRFTDVMAEKEGMERELEKLRVGDGELNLSTLRHPNTESRLKQQVEVLEKAKRDLRTEMREKTLTEAKERRELERKSRSELADMKGKVASAEWEKDKLEREIKDLKEYATRLERELETTKKDNDELKKKLADQTPARNDSAREWQSKQRTTLQELRRVNEETSTLRVQKGDVEEQLRSARKDIENLKFQLDSLPAKPAATAPETKEPESASDDSAVDRSFDRWTKAATSSATDASSPFTPGTKSPITRSAAASVPTFANSPPVPALANRQKRLFSAENVQKENSDILPTPPECSAFMQTPKAAKTQEDTLFYQQRRQRESPRAKIVNLAITPPTSSAPAAGRKVSGVGKVIPRRVVSGSAGRLSNMDPARREAAEKRLAERKKARLASAGIA